MKVRPEIELLLKKGSLQCVMMNPQGRKKKSRNQNSECPTNVAQPMQRSHPDQLWKGIKRPKEEVKKKVMGMYTDPNRIHGDEPGNVGGNPVFTYLDAFASESDKSQVLSYKSKYKEGQIKDSEVKEFLVKVLEEFLEPIRKRRAEYEKQPEQIDKILKEGTEKARAEAQKTLGAVKAAMKINYFS